MTELDVLFANGRCKQKTKRKDYVPSGEVFVAKIFNGGNYGERTETQ